MAKVYIVKPTKENGMKGGFTFRLRPNDRTESLSEELQKIVKANTILYSGKENAFDEELIDPDTLKKQVDGEHMRYLADDVSEAGTAIKEKYKFSDEDWSALIPNLDFDASNLKDASRAELDEICESVFETAEVEPVKFKNMPDIIDFLTAGE